MEKSRGYRSPLGPLWAASEARPSEDAAKGLPEENLEEGLKNTPEGLH